KGRDVVACWSNGGMVPVNKAHVEPTGSRDNENVDAPQIAMQQRLRATPCGQRACAVRQFLPQFVEPVQESGYYRGFLWQGLARIERGSDFDDIPIYNGNT